MKKQMVRGTTSTEMTNFEMQILSLRPEISENVFIMFQGADLYVVQSKNFFLTRENPQKVSRVSKKFNFWTIEVIK